MTVFMNMMSGNTMRNLIPLAILAVCGALAPSDAQAQGWCNGFGLGIGGLYRSLDYPTESRVPYFAAHPPVYYSFPVPRTYGHSPFAYGPDVRTPEVMTAAKTPVEIVNPYVSNKTREAAESSAKQRKSVERNRTISSGAEAEPSGPLMIENPFFQPSSRSRAI